MSAISIPCRRWNVAFRSTNGVCVLFSRDVLSMIHWLLSVIGIKPCSLFVQEEAPFICWSKRGCILMQVMPENKPFSLFHLP